MHLFFSIASRAVARSRDSRSNSRSVSPIPSVTKVEPSVVQDQFKWTIYMSRVNLPALLNDPRLTRRETDFFSKTWGEAFERATVLPAHQIPTITREHFKRYIKKTSKVRKAMRMCITCKIFCVLEEPACSPDPPYVPHSPNVGLWPAHAIFLGSL